MGDVMRDLFRDSCMQERIDERRAVRLWSHVAGEEITRQCRNPEVRNGIMSIGVPNASLRQELHMNRSRLCASINKIIGRETIKDIKFTS